jgi:hypothetical protein
VPVFLTVLGTNADLPGINQQPFNGRVSVQHIIEQPSLSLQPSPLLVAFAKRQVRNAQMHAGPERRNESRELMVIPVVVQPIDEHNFPLAQPLAMVTRDLATRGVSLIHEQRLLYDRLALRFIVQDEEAILVGAVRWKKPVGPFYSCGCEIVGRLDTFPSSLPRNHALSPAFTRLNSAAASEFRVHLSDGPALA